MGEAHAPGRVAGAWESAPGYMECAPEMHMLQCAQ